jgi:hypothetical protein
MSYRPDLSPFPSKEESRLGLQPLAVGWLSANKPYPTGSVPAGFVDALLPLCADANILPGSRRDAWCELSRDCPRPVTALEHEGAPVSFAGQIRVIGPEDIFAAPALIYHYVTVHGYRPPASFIEAVLKGARAGSAEQRAYLKTLRRGL